MDCSDLDKNHGLQTWNIQWISCLILTWIGVFVSVFVFFLYWVIDVQFSCWLMLLCVCVINEDVISIHFNVPLFTNTTKNVICCNRLARDYVNYSINLRLHEWFSWNFIVHNRTEKHSLPNPLNKWKFRNECGIQHE